MKTGKEVKGASVLSFGSYYLNGQLGNYEALQIKKRGKSSHLAITDKFGNSRRVTIQESLKWARERMKANGQLQDEGLVR